MTIKGWLLGVFSVVVIIELVFNILPEGKTNKYIKGFFLLILALVVLKPVTLVKDVVNFDYNKQLNTSVNNVEFQTEYLEYVVKNNVKSRERQCEILLENCKFKGAKVEIEYIHESGVEFTVKKVKVNLENAVINGDDEHINIIEKAREVLCEFLSIDSEAIEFNE